MQQAVTTCHANVHSKKQNTGQGKISKSLYGIEKTSPNSYKQIKYSVAYCLKAGKMIFI